MGVMGLLLCEDVIQARFRVKGFLWGGYNVLMDDAVMTVGDVGWRGFRSRPDPLTLPDGIAAVAENMRFVRGRAEVRRGAKRLLDGVSVGTVPVVLPVDLGVDVAVSGITRTGGTATVVTAVAHGLSTGAQVNIRGADQGEYNGDVVVTVVDATTFTYAVAGSPVSPATGTMLMNNGPEIRDSYTGGIFGACAFSSPGSDVTGNGDEYIALFGSDACYLYRYGESVLTKLYASGETIEEADYLTMVQAFDKLFLFRGRDISGDYARKSCTVSRSSTTVTVTCVGHGFVTGNRVSIEGANEGAYNIEADITRTSDDVFTFQVLHSPASPGTGTITCRRVKPPMVWDGGSGNFVRYGGGSHAAGPTYSTLRSTGVACYQNNQLFIAATPMKDTVLVSDTLDPNTFDPLLVSFRANAGSDDYIVAMLPFAEGVTLIFGRKSIYRARIVMDYATGTSLDPTSSFIELVTSEVGCRAPRSIVVAGQYVYFLSDNGVYRLDTSYTDLKVRGVTLPLSDAVADLFDDISESAVGSASAVWHDSRYWLAVPMYGSESPNYVVVWNALMDEWESVDSFPAPMTSLLVSDYADRRRLFAASKSGKLFVLDELEDGDDPSSELTAGRVDIAGRLVSRRYNGGDMIGKRWMRVVAGVSLPAAAGIAVTLNTYDLDGSLLLGTVTNTGGADEGYVLKLSARARGSAAEVEFSNAGAGRPMIKSCQLDMTGARPGFSTRTEE